MIRARGARWRRSVVLVASTAIGLGMVTFLPPASAAVGDLVLASTSGAGVKGNGESSAQVLSADGSTVAFASSANNLDPADTDFRSDIYVKNLTTGALTLASTSEAAIKGNRSSSHPSLSADGSTVAFVSSATNLDPADTDSLSDIYVKNLTTGALTLASTSEAAIKGNGNSVGPALSADGTIVAFDSTAINLDPADTDTIRDVYVKNVVSGEVVLASTSGSGVKSDGLNADPTLSADGDIVAFSTFATNLDPDDTDRIRDVYVKDLASGNVTLASTSDTEAKGNGESHQPVLSADGSTVAFHSTATNLDPIDTDGTRDVYVKDLASGDIAVASASGTGVKSNGSSSDPSLSADGSAVAFRSTATNLDPLDADSTSDVYVRNPAVTPAVSTTALSPSPNPVATGAPLTLTATVTGPAPTAGTVTFSDPGGELGSVPVQGDGTAVLVTSELPAGSHPITATYGGNRALLPSTSEAVVVEVIDPVVLGATVPDGQVGVPYEESVPFTGGGTVTFAVSAGSLPPGLSLDSTGSLTGTPTAAGRYDVEVTATNEVSSAVQLYALTIDKATSTLIVTSTANPAGLREPLFITAQVTTAAGVTPTGTVRFAVNGKAVGPLFPVAADGSTTGGPLPLPAGEWAISAVYSGDDAVAGSNGAMTQAVHYVVEVLSPTAGSEVAAGSVLTVAFKLTDVEGRPIPDSVAQGLVAGSCQALRVSATGAQRLPSLCPAYDVETDTFSLARPTATEPTGEVTLAVTVSYRGAAVPQVATVTFTLV